MLDVELMPIQDSLVLRARGSELLILPAHITELKKLTQPKEFARYFLDESLINRPARKLFLAWLRKDQGLWRRIFDTIKGMELTGESEKGDPTNLKQAKTVIRTEMKTEIKTEMKTEIKTDSPIKTAKSAKATEIKEEKPKAKIAAKKETVEAKPKKKEIKPTSEKAKVKPAAKAKDKKETKKPAGKKK